MAKCATCVLHEKDKHMENAWFSSKYNQAKTMRFPCVYSTYVAHLAIFKFDLNLQ